MAETESLPPAPEAEIDYSTMSACPALQQVEAPPQVLEPDTQSVDCYRTCQQLARLPKDTPHVSIYGSYVLQSIIYTGKQGVTMRWYDQSEGPFNGKWSGWTWSEDWKPDYVEYLAQRMRYRSPWDDILRDETYEMWRDRKSMSPADQETWMAYNRRMVDDVDVNAANDRRMNANSEQVKAAPSETDATSISEQATEASWEFVAAAARLDVEAAACPARVGNEDGVHQTLSNHPGSLLHTGAVFTIAMSANGKSKICRYFKDEGSHHMADMDYVERQGGPHPQTGYPSNSAETRTFYMDLKNPDGTPYKFARVEWMVYRFS